MSDKPISSQAAKASGRGCMFIFGAIFCAAGLGFFWFVAIEPMLKSNASGDWIEAQGKVVSSKVKTSRSDGSTTYKPYVEFEYDFDGQRHLSETFDFTALNRAKERCKKIVADHPAGKQITCYVDPDNPEQAVIERSYDFSWFGFLFPLSFAVIGLGCMIGCFWPQRAGAKSISGRLKKKTGPASGVMGLTQQSNFSADSSSQHPGDVEDQAWDQPQKLKPQQSRLTGFIVVLLAAVFWNGVVGFMIFGAVKEFGDTWLPFLFMIPFAIVGLLIAAGAVHALAAMFNPSVEMALSTGAVGRGDSVDIAWQLEGRVSRLRSLKVCVEGKESATYRRGTDTITSDHVFCRIPIAEVSERQEMEFGSATITIPVDTMHTFSADRNQVNWSVVVKGDVPFWADVKETFDFRVKP